jgi:uncharacterized protein YjbI with pentapeptide repeats
LSKYTREEILKLIEENGGPEGLDLSGKDLSGIDLARDAITAEFEKAQERALDVIPVWYCELTGGINLQDANLQGANLPKANLQGANLVCANLQEAIMWEANLREAYLCADLEGADMADANLQNSKLWDANLQGSYLGEANLQGADLEDADLRAAVLEHANFQGANLRYSHLEKMAFFAAASLDGAYFYNAFLDDTRLKREQLGEAIGEELDGKYDEAKEAYLALKNNFAEIGRYEDAAWAYRKERRMEKLAALQKAKEAWQEHDWKGTVPHYVKVAIDQLVECVCDYGESVPRVLCSLLAVYILFTLIYGLTWSVIRVYATSAAIIKEPTRNLVDLARFSLGAMTTMDITGLEPRNGLVELLAGLEALFGIALTGLLGFVVGNRIRRA